MPTLGLDVDACIDLIVAGEGGSAKVTVTVFRGKAARLYGRSGPRAEWITDLLLRVGQGKVRLSPPLERRVGKQPKLSMPLSEGGSSPLSAGPTPEIEPLEDESEALPELPEAVAGRLRGDGLDADVCRCAEALQTLQQKAPQQSDVSGEDLSLALARAALRACIDQNLGEWEDLDGKPAWRRAALKRLAGTGERLHTLAAREDSGDEEDIIKVDGALLILDPAGVIEFGERNTAKLSLRNSASGFVAYRIRTNAPKHTNVKPCAGTLRKGERALAKIVVTDKRAGGSSLKFVVQAAEVPSSAAISREDWHAFDKAATQEWTLDGHGLR